MIYDVNSHLFKSFLAASGGVGLAAKKEAAAAGGKKADATKPLAQGKVFGGSA
jgi:hypothetical protein